jgi:solute carrier family 35 protein F5
VLLTSLIRDSSFFGVALVALSDQNSTQALLARVFNNTDPGRSLILGDGLALISALFYALYVTLLKVKIKDESRINMQLFFGFVGLFNIILGLPLLVLFHFTKVETLELPRLYQEWIALLVNVNTFQAIGSG